MLGLLIVLILIIFALVYLLSLGSTKRKKTEQAFGYYMQQNAMMAAQTAEVAKRRRVKQSDKAMVFERDRYTCQICGISKGFVDSLYPGLGDYLLLEVDHIQSVAQGGTGADIDNLQCLCWRCNRKKGGKKTNEEVRNSIDYGVNYYRNNINV